MIEPISYKGKTFGYIIKYTRKLGVNFLTPKKLSHQVGFIKHKSKHLIKPHKHYKNVRRIEYTSEVLIILKGSVTPIKTSATVGRSSIDFLFLDCHATILCCNTVAEPLKFLSRFLNSTLLLFMHPFLAIAFFYIIHNSFLLFKR